MLAVKEIDDSQLLIETYELKKWYFRCGSTPQGVDRACAYSKYLCKLAQALFLRAPLPEKHPEFPKFSIFETCEIFGAIKQMIHLNGRSQTMTRKTAFMLSQIASFSRAGPYPSKQMVKESVEKTISLLEVEKHLEKEAAAKHRGGLARIMARLHEPSIRQTHLSLSGSGALELPREQGGKGKYMADFARTLATCEINNSKELGQVVGLVDCYGQEVIAADVARQAVRRLVESKPVTWGDVMYVPLIDYGRRLFEGEQRVPLGLAKILLLISSAELKKYGSFNSPEVPNPLKIPLFKGPGIAEFEPNIKALPVKAALSIESAGKCRLVTSNPAAYTQVGQCINHFMRQWLSQDSFCRIGFEESDKLWELLKDYSKAYASGRFTHNLDGPE